MGQNQPVELDLDNVNALIAELETDFQQIQELTPTEGNRTTNNSCGGPGTCYTF